MSEDCILRQKVGFVLLCKKNELQKAGYKDITEDDIWFCLEQLFWRNVQPHALHQFVSDIFNVTQKHVMDYLQLRTLNQCDQYSITDIFQEIVR